MAKNLITTLQQLVRVYRADQIQLQLAKIYKQYSAGSLTEVEFEYWLKCNKASKNLSSGMLKWLEEMIDDLKEEKNE
jgi:hypothetical protein